MKKRLIIPTLLALVAIAIVLGFVFKDDIDSTLFNARHLNYDDNKPTFKFDDNRFSGWWSSGNTYTTNEDYDQALDKEAVLPASSLAIHEDSEPNSSNKACFVNYSHYEHTVDTAIALDKFKQQTIKGRESNLILEEVNVQSLEINTHEGPKQYQLHQFDMQGAHTGNLLRGISYGHIPLSKGYVDIRSYCNSAEDLPKVLHVLSAVEIH